MAAVSARTRGVFALRACGDVPTMARKGKGEITMVGLGKGHRHNCRCFTGCPPRGIPKVVSLGEEKPRSGTRRCKEHNT
jgi:hypothetical protein